ncbi:MAG: 3-hydroxyacyl-CoA dehydrogenase NAD-binding domain-containing protein [Candidatus Brocadiia bacterium]|nr:3-hydroxyacyl-CoA dehydrogenase NAD-binding domain-containing protein [Candidatus Brocadiia bacterium]
MGEQPRPRAVVGAGLMGHGIAQVLARLPGAVRLYDVSGDTLDSAMARIGDSLAMLVRRGLVTEADSRDALARIAPTTDLAAAVASASFVIEAAPEDLELKRRLFAEVERLAPADAVLATNTSSLSIAQVSALVEGRQRVVGSHFFLPAQIVPLVEVARGEATSDETMSRTVDLWRACGKAPIRVEVDIPGYVANRLQGALVREAISLWGRDIASAADIDAAVRVGFGLRFLQTGPLAQRDIGGLDLHLAVSQGIWPDLDQRTETHPRVRSKVERGELGLKSGRGFHDWAGRDPDEVRRALDEALVSMMAALGIWPTGSRAEGDDG